MDNYQRNLATLASCQAAYDNVRPPEYNDPEECPECGALMEESTYGGWDCSECDYGINDDCESGYDGILGEG